MHEVVRTSVKRMCWAEGHSNGEFVLLPGTPNVSKVKSFRMTVTLVLELLFPVNINILLG